MVGHGCGELVAQEQVDLFIILEIAEQKARERIDDRYVGGPFGKPTVESFDELVAGKRTLKFKPGVSAQHLYLLFGQPHFPNHLDELLSFGVVVLALNDKDSQRPRGLNSESDLPDAPANS